MIEANKKIDTIRFGIDRCYLGFVLVKASHRGLCSIELANDMESMKKSLPKHVTKARSGENDLIEKTLAWLHAYLDNPRTPYKLPLDPQGTTFQKRVWQALMKIPVGSRITYSQLAISLGAPRSVRAVAGACAANRLAVAVPCHRVVRSDGSLAGYRWGVTRKAELLRIESNISATGEYASSSASLHSVFR